MAHAPLDLRQQQTRLTRDLIMDALVDLLLEQGVQDFSIQQVADKAGVSHRTVYRHFPNRQALLEALAQWLDDRFAERYGAQERAYSDLPAAVERSFCMMDELPRHMQAYVMLMTATGSSATPRDKRTRRMRKAVEKGPAAGLAPADAKAVSAVMRVLTSSMTWYQLTQQLGLDGGTAGRTMRWVLQTLLDELERGGGPTTSEP